MSSLQVLADNTLIYIREADTKLMMKILNEELELMAACLDDSKLKYSEDKVYSIYQ